jgi:phage terminase large subunit-like protein
VARSSTIPRGTASRTVDLLFPEPWEPKGRPTLEPHQIPPDSLVDGDSDLWLLEAGRGSGKTEACSRYFAKYMHENPGHRGTIVAPTAGDAVEACVHGPSGLKSVDPEVEFKPSAPGGMKVVWPSGSEALLIGTHSPRDIDRLRAGGNRHIIWWEEMAANPHLKEAWDIAAFGLRLGEHPHSIGSTTPRNTTEYRAIRGMDGVVFTKASLFDNPHNPKRWVEKMRKRYEGTRLGRQELRGELLDDVPGALWSRFILESVRVPAEEGGYPDMAYVVVAIDPAATANEDSSDTGIVVCGLGVNGKGYVLEDATCHLEPDGWGTRAIRKYEKWQADLIVGEVNNGGDMVEYVIASLNPKVAFKQVRASRGKQTRAQPIATLYGNGRTRDPMIHHVGAFPELEDQLCTWVPGEEDSPDRLDALVWGFTEIFLEEQEDEYVEEEWTPVKIGADV